MLGLGFLVGMIATASPPSPPDASLSCGPKQVAWADGCFHRDEWRPDEKSCPEGVILIPEGEDHPRCTPCEKEHAQQPMNYCAGLRAKQAEVELNQVYRDLWKKFPRHRIELRKDERAWMNDRDVDCERERNQHEGGSIASMIYSDCLYKKTRKRVEELKELRRRWSKP